MNAADRLEPTGGMKRPEAYRKQQNFSFSTPMRFVDIIMMEHKKFDQ